VLGTEACHWRVDDDSPSNDAEVLAAAMPSLSMTPGGGILILASSPYRKSGVMFDRWRDLWGNDDAEALCWVAPSMTMNPVLPVEIVEAALEDDPAKNRSEYLACWREDLSDCVPSDCVDACTEWTVRERPYDGRNKYVAFTDAAGGTGSDAFGLVIAHRDKHNRAIVDVIRERKPRFIPALVVQEYSELLHAYGIREVVGDRFSGGWCASEFSVAASNINRATRTRASCISPACRCCWRATRCCSTTSGCGGSSASLSAGRIGQPRECRSPQRSER
jgi:hypothetical protein